jgi:hypothetical protein
VNIEELTMTISDLEGVAPAGKIESNRDAANVAAWLDETRKTEASADEILGPAIKEAYDAHRALTGSRKKLFEKLEEFKSKLRGQLAGWIDRGHPVDSYRIQPKWTIVGFNLAEVPEEYKVTTVDEKKVLDWIKQTDGKMVIPGVEFKSVPILFAKGEK